MYHNKVELCGINTAQLPVLTEREKAQLLRRVKQGDRQARQEMIQGNLRLVLSVVQRFSGRGENLDDLFQVGCIGLIKAIDNFDPDLNLRFSTYGVPMIIGEIRRFLRDNNALRVSRSVRDVAYRAMQCREQLQKKLGREPHINEIAKAVNLPKETVTLALESVVEPVSLYEPVYSDGPHLCDGSGGRNRRGGQLDQRHYVPGYRGQPDRPGKEDHGAALPLRHDPGGGRQGDRHQPGTGKPPGKGGAGAHSRRDVKAKPCAEIRNQRLKTQKRTKKQPPTGKPAGGCFLLELFSGGRLRHRREVNYFISLQTASV